MSRPPLTQQRLKALLTYDPATGEFHWRVNRGNNGGGSAMPGDRAGTTYSDGYRNISIDGKRYGAHRLAFLYMTGNLPAHMVDHRDLDPSNNRWSNLREATCSQNNANKPTRNRFGVKGVKQGRSGRFEASIRIDGKRKYLGTFDTLADAGAAYADAANDAFGEFARAS